MTSICAWRLSLRPANWDCARTTAGQAKARRDWGQSTERWRCDHWCVRVGGGSYGGRRQLCRPGRPWGKNNRKICQWYLGLKGKVKNRSNVQLPGLIHSAQIHSSEGLKSSRRIELGHILGETGTFWTFYLVPLIVFLLPLGSYLEEKEEEQAFIPYFLYLNKSQSSL